MTGGIYSLTNKANGKRYIGQTLDFHKRKTTHLWMLNNNRHFNPHLQRAWNAGDEFAFEVIEECPEEIRNEREIFWIAEFNATDDNFGYNLCDGGDATTGYHFTEEQKRKISESNRGRKCTQETIKRRTESLKKHLADDPEFARKLSEEKSRRWKGKPSWNKGIPCTEEKKKILSEKLKGRYVSPEHKQRLKDLYSGENSITAKLKKSDVVEIRYRFLCGERQIDIAKDYPVTPQTIYDIIRNRRWKNVPNTKEELEKYL